MDFLEFLKSLGSPQIGPAMDSMAGEGQYGKMRELTRGTSLDPILGGLETATTPSNLMGLLSIVGPGVFASGASQGAGRAIPQMVSKSTPMLDDFMGYVQQMNATGSNLGPAQMEMVNQLLKIMGPR